MNECCKQTYKNAFKEVVVLLNSQLANLSIGAVIAALNFAIKDLEKDKK
jgi:hypothetical protein